ncbi:granulocyte colony-stimulating factor receptor [Astyanax mexicanus]|uniref:Granulocyte colony-stimulating factor receptor n=2 Tax=Astyanax mexicanus TaxID=7994 RepID=A0A8T2M660_ASTMX|nr:granulocyte colony-stimulating factor receptor [Astyanax mexicanus]
MNEMRLLKLIFGCLADINIMKLHWLPVRVMLWSTMCSFTANVKASPCAEIRTLSAVVLSGSPVTASCYIKEDCPLTKRADFHVEWPYKANLSYASVTSHEERVYQILISNLTNMIAMLECAICIHEDCNVVAGMEIKAAYPPPAPRDLTCGLNLTEQYSLLCTWDPGQETSIPTTYKLHTEIRDSAQKFVYIPPPGKHFFRIPRVGFALFNDVQVQVVAENALGRATSEPLVLDPMETAKLDPPEIQTVRAETYECLGLRWSLSKAQKWITRTLYVEIRMKPMSNKVLNREHIIFKKSRSGNTVQACKLLHGMMYQSEMRVRYHSSPWSEWSRPSVATTRMKAPTGRLVTWLKLLGQPANRQYEAELLWKPSLQFRANSMNVSYVVSFVRPPGRKEELCITDQQHCSFSIPVDIKRIHLTAVNKAGKSSPTDVTVYKWKGGDRAINLKAFPVSEESIFTNWSSPKSSAISAYVLEWKALHEGIFTTVSFEIVNKNQSALVFPGLEPYKPYNFSIYPKYKDVIGQPSSVVAYTKEKAPLESPDLKIGDLRPSSIELLWDELPLQKRNGNITSYTVFYWDKKNKTGEAKVTERRVVLKDLSPYSVYSVQLMTSTNGGSVNGSVISVMTPYVDAIEIVLIVIPACVGLALLFLTGITCFSNDKCLKKCLWPMIPDPANSSIKKWTLTDSMQDIPPLKEVKDPVPVHLSHFSLLSLSETELWKGNTPISEYPHCGKWTYTGKSVDEEHSDSSRDSGIYNSGSQSESVPYATVVFANPYRTQPAAPPAYLRSESTQPLLAEEEPSSPQPYEQMATQGTVYGADHFSAVQEDLRREEENESHWVDFPMLQSLEINDINNQG